MSQKKVIGHLGESRHPIHLTHPVIVAYNRSEDWFLCNHLLLSLIICDYSFLYQRLSKYNPLKWRSWRKRKIWFSEFGNGQWTRITAEATKPQHWRKTWMNTCGNSLCHIPSHGDIDQPVLNVITCAIFCIQIAMASDQHNSLMVFLFKLPWQAICKIVTFLFKLICRAICILQVI